MTLTNSYITLAQFKDWATVEDTVNDNMIDVAINAACRAIDEYTHRRFYSDGAATARVYQATNPHRLRVDDFSTVTGLTVITDEANSGTYGTTWTITTDFVVKPSGGNVDSRTFPFYEIVATGSRTFPTYGPRDRVQVTANWGWASVPSEVVEAALIEAHRLIRRKDSPEGIAGGFELGAIRLSKYMDPDAQRLLAPFVRANALVL